MNPYRYPLARAPWIAIALVFANPWIKHHAAEREWRAFGGDPANTQYSELAQITPENVHQLEVAWSYDAGGADANNRSQIQCNPLIVDSVLYGTSPKLRLFALDAATGEELWGFDPFANGGASGGLGVNRGLVYWEGEEGKRILYCAGQQLHSIDTETGKPDAQFGANGSVDLREGLDRDPSELFVISNTPGILYRDLLIVGSRVSEGPGPSSPGHIRAYDVRTGAIRWVFRTIPRPGEYGYETWPEDAWTRVGGANSWTGMSLDPVTGTAYIPTGSPAFDFWGGDRHGANLFGNCLLAIDAATGRRKWHFQFVHHDLWDRDLPAAPNLVTIHRDGRDIRAVAQVTKSGHVFVFDRDTGEPVFPIEEQPFPPSDLNGELASPTQPLPIAPPPFSRQRFTEADVTTISPESHATVLERLRQVRSGGQFVPPSEAGTIIFPGFDGGGEWGGAAVDPHSGFLYVNGNEMPWILTMVPVSKEGSLSGLTPGESIYRRNCVACHGPERQGAPGQNVPSLVGIENRTPKADAAEILNQGKGVMPAFSFLSPIEKSTVLDFIYGDEPIEARVPTNAGTQRRGAAGVPYTHTGYNRFFDPEGYPAVRPPWGTLNAIDLNQGTIAWSVPLGEFDELTERGIPKTGAENYGGPVVTRGGLIFIGASKDQRFRAFDQATGDELWRADLPAGGYATPATYEVGGRQFVVIAAGGGKMGTKSGSSYVAFALPKEQP